MACAEPFNEATLYVMGSYITSSSTSSVLSTPLRRYGLTASLHIKHNLLNRRQPHAPAHSVRPNLASRLSWRSAVYCTSTVSNDRYRVDEGDNSVSTRWN